MARIDALLELPDERTTGAEPAPMRGAPVFELRGVSFSYAAEKALRGVSLSILEGDKVAVVGRSGSGKTTLFKLLNGLYEPDEGSLLFRGQALSALSIDALRRRLSVVPQEAFVFEGTVLENVTVAKPGAMREEAAAACAAAQLAEWAEGLPDGYDTPLGGVAAPLSNGQLQRLGLARAFLRDTDVWLLDEPTSALDARNRDAVMDRLLNDGGRRTVVCILHEPELISVFRARVYGSGGGRPRRTDGRGETVLKSIFAYIRKRPVLWLVGLVLPALASFAVNFGFSLSLNAYTAELTSGDAAFRSILLLMAATAVSLVFAVIVEDAARHIFFAFTVKTQNDVKQAMYESIVRTKYAALGGTDRGALYTLYTRDTATAASIPAGDLFGILFPGARGRLLHRAVRRPCAHRRNRFGADGRHHRAESGVRQPLPRAGGSVAGKARGVCAQR
ncbi:MAG: ATP-binding cassette domain-containing protein [Acutalibacteraceae bacterium]